MKLKIVKEAWRKKNGKGLTDTDAHWGTQGEIPVARASGHRE